MITADEARKLHRQEESRKALVAKREQAAARVRAAKYDKYLREEKFPETLAEIEALIKEAIKDGERKVETKIGEDSTGKILGDLLVPALVKSGSVLAIHLSIRLKITTCVPLTATTVIRLTRRTQSTWSGRCSMRLYKP